MTLTFSLNNYLKWYTFTPPHWHVIEPPLTTCPLHAEAKAENGNPAKADILICNPLKPNSFNYATEVIVELKDRLTGSALRTELKKFATYSDLGIRRLYVIPANRTTLTDYEKANILADYRWAPGVLAILDRSIVTPRKTRTEKSAGIRRPLVVRVSECISRSLKLYGRNRDQYQGFFWCNYEHETGKGWTFPVEGDFNAQLYNFLRTKLPGAQIQTGHRPTSGARSRVDFFITETDESVGVEVKMNWDQMRFQPGRKKQETEGILQKFEALSLKHASHSNLLVVIQGEDGHKSNNKAEAMRQLQGRDFSLLYFDERRNSPVGPVAI